MAHLLGYMSRMAAPKAYANFTTKGVTIISTEIPRQRGEGDHRLPLRDQSRISRSSLITTASMIVKLARKSGPDQVGISDGCNGQYES